MSIDLALAVAVDAENPVAHDLRLIDGQFVFVQGIDAIKQHLRVRLQFFLKEWFLDEREGVPFYRDVLIKDPQPQTLRSIFRQVVLDTPGIEVLNFLNLVLDSRTRTVDIAFEARVTGGEVLAVDFGEFIIGVI